MPEPWLTPAICVLALLLDRWLGETSRLHPLVGFGRLAQQVEIIGNTAMEGLLGRGQGVMAWLFLVLPIVGLLWVLDRYLQVQQPLGWLGFNVLMLYLAIGWQSMREHVILVADSLKSDDLIQARQAVAQIVSRDTGQAEADQLLKASLETTLENSADALFSSLFWYVIAGVPGVVLHRLANTLDAMWGYRTARFACFGWWAARCDDLLNFLPSQLLALSFVLLRPGKPVAAAWFGQGWRWKSINAGSVMAAGAAALGIELGGGARYGGQWQRRSILGQGRSADLTDFRRAFGLVNHSLLLWLVIIAVVSQCQFPG